MELGRSGRRDDDAAAAAPAAMVPAPIERSQLPGHRQQIGKSAALTVGRSPALSQRCGRCGSERSAEFGSVYHFRCPHARARIIGKNKAAADQPPRLELFYKESDSNERLRVGDWIVQRLYDYAVKKTVELRLLAVFQHIADPTRVRAVAD